jgi:hypothetical protein
MYYFREIFPEQGCGVVAVAGIDGQMFIYRERRCCAGYEKLPKKLAGEVSTASQTCRDGSWQHWSANEF